MSNRSDFDAIADACIKAGELVNRNGSPALKAIMRVLLYTLAQELLARDSASRSNIDAS